MIDTAKIAKLLDELELRHASQPVEPDLVRFDISVSDGDGEDAAVTGLLYSTEDGEFLRLLAFIDELDSEAPLDQLRLLMALNGELPLGAFCMDPDDDIIYATANLPVEELDAEYLGWVIEFLFAAQEIYDTELGLDPGDSNGGMV